MLLKGNVFAPLGCGVCLCLQNHGCVLAVGSDQQVCGGKNAFQGRLVIHQHVAGAGTHKNLHAAGQTWIDAFDGLQIVVGRAEVKTVVGSRAIGCAIALVD